MKKETEFYHQAESQNQRSIANVSSEVNRLKNHWKLNDVYFNFAAVRKILSGSAGWTSDSLCKGPPGRPLARGHPPEPIAVSRSSPRSTCRGEPPELIEAWPEFIEAWPEFIEGRNGVSRKTHSLTTTNFNKQNTNDKQILFFKNLLIFKIMKKQILFLAFFVLALFSGTSTTWGQALVPGITATQPIDPLSCIAGSLPLHPYPGQSYTYTMDGTTNAANLASQWTWFATKDPSFISLVGGVPTLNTSAMLTTASGDLLNVGANYGVPSATNSIQITWSPEILAGTQYQGTGSPGTPTFVVGYATGANCSDNIQVYEINPMFNFVVDIANINPATNTTMAWDATTNQCVDIVQTAAYNSTSKELDMDYGKDTLYFEVAAANFVNDWTPTFRLISGLTGVQTAEVGLASSLANAQAGTFLTGGTTSWTAASVGTDWATGIALTASNPADAITGVSAYVRVIISNITEESLADNVFSLAVDARDNGNAGIWDMENDDCPSGGGTDAADQIDYAEHTINPRPTINMDGGAMSEPSGTTPENVITKTP